MKLKKFFFMLWHWICLPFVLIALSLSLSSSKGKYNNLIEDEDNAMTLSERHEYVYKLASRAVFCSFAKVKVKGEKNIPANKPVLFVPNHKSNFDVLVFLKALKKIKEDKSGILDTTFVSKIEISKTKKISYVAKLINTIFLDRNNLRDIVRVNKEEKELLQKGEQSLTIFIEGTRIKNHEFGEFKSAALTPAYSTFCQIVPVVIYGTLGVEKESKKNIFKYKEVTVEFLESIKYKDYIQVSKDLVCEKMKSKMEKAYLKLKEDPYWKEGDEQEN